MLESGLTLREASRIVAIYVKGSVGVLVTAAPSSASDGVNVTPPQGTRKMVLEALSRMKGEIILPPCRIVD